MLVEKLPKSQKEYYHNKIREWEKRTGKSMNVKGVSKFYNSNMNYESCTPSIELEKKYYKEIFDRFYPNCSHILPYFWMPKYTTATDPSARTLDVYNK